MPNPTLFGNNNHSNDKIVTRSGGTLQGSHCSKYMCINFFIVLRWFNHYQLSSIFCGRAHISSLWRRNEMPSYGSAIWISRCTNHTWFLEEYIHLWNMFFSRMKSYTKPYLYISRKWPVCFKIPTALILLMSAAAPAPNSPGFILSKLEHLM